MIAREATVWSDRSLNARSAVRSPPGTKPPGRPRDLLRMRAVAVSDVSSAPLGVVDRLVLFSPYPTLDPELAHPSPPTSASAGIHILPSPATGSGCSSIHTS
jgi:hypothetical protein